jgi:RNase P subunit RPR2
MSAEEVHEYRCKRCRHMVFKGTLGLAQHARTQPSLSYIETKCRKCGGINRFALAVESTPHC